MKEMATTLKVKLCKVENWFKHKRRMDVSLGLMKFERKKVFCHYEKILLQKEFELNKNPSEEKYQELYDFFSVFINLLILRANNFNCQKKNIKNWFSYRRKLLLKFRRKKMISKKEQKTLEIQLKVEGDRDQNKETMNQNLQFLWFLNWTARLNESFRIFRMNQVLLNLASHSY